MTYRFFSVAAVALIAGCSGEAEESRQVTRDFVVERLFTHEGCTVYRFKDVERRYFTNCTGSVEWSTGGKTRKHHTVPTEVTK